MNDKILKKVENALLNVDLETLTLKELGEYVMIANEVDRNSAITDMVHNMMANCFAPQVECEAKTIGSISEVN